MSQFTIDPEEVPAISQKLAEEIRKHEKRDEEQKKDEEELRKYQELSQLVWDRVNENPGWKTYVELAKELDMEEIEVRSLYNNRRRQYWKKLAIERGETEKEEIRVENYNKNIWE